MNENISDLDYDIDFKLYDKKTLQEIEIEELKEKALIKIKNKFENYQEDVLFNGKKKLIKINIEELDNLNNLDSLESLDNLDNLVNNEVDSLDSLVNNEVINEVINEVKIKKVRFKIVINYIKEIGYNFNELTEQNIIIDDDNNNNHNYYYDYLKKLINNRIIENGKIYDLNNILFQKTINKFKHIKNKVIFSKETDDIIKKYNNSFKIEIFGKIEVNTIEYLFQTDSLVNGIPCYKVSYNTYNISKNFYNLIPNYFIIYKIKNNNYELNYLHTILPYLIEINKISKEYYVYNFEYQLIGYDKIYSIGEIDNTYNKLEWYQVHIYGNSDKCIISNDNTFKHHKYIYNKLKKTHLLTNMLNMNISKVLPLLYNFTY
jgi:hypothetical protein